MSYNPDYYKEYYKQHKAEILAAKGERYRQDARYRQGILRRAKVSSVVRTMTNQKQRQAFRVLHAGKAERIFHITHMGPMVNRDRAVLDDWRKSEPPIIPAALYYDKRGRGVYTESQVTFISKVLHRLDTGKLSMTYNELRLFLDRVWSETFSEKLLTKRIRETLHGNRSEEEGSRKVRQSRYSDKASV